ncbi:MAG: hypothetical protein ABEJ89_09195 [Haloarculaceae archaeon]
MPDAPADPPDSAPENGTDHGTPTESRPDDTRETGPGTEETDAGLTAPSLGEDEDSPAEAFGMRVGILLAAVGVGGLFVGPAPPFALAPGDSPFLLALRDVPDLGPFPSLAGAALVTGLLSGLLYTATADDRDAAYRGELAIGLVVPAAMLALAVVAVVAFSPAVHYALAGQVLLALAALFGASVLAAAALTFFRVTAAATLVALLYLALPAYLGVWLGSHLARLAGQG